MATVLPGTVIEVSKLESGISRTLFDGIFAAGGITLSQVSIMTGLEPYMIQNWVKRGFVSPPVKRVYAKNQFARIIIINMLRESLQLDKITLLLECMNRLTCCEDDCELYHKYVDMLARTNDGESLDAAVCDISEEKPLKTVLKIMGFAHFASVSRNTAEQLLAEL